jgi:RNA polymerase sigma-70 factor, ECF subfamily
VHHHGSDRHGVFLELLTLHQRGLYGYIHVFVPNPTDAEDLLQETTLRLWQTFDEFDLNRSFSAWARRIAYRQVLHYLRKKRRSRVVFDDDVVARLAKIHQDREEMGLQDTGNLDRCIEELSSNDQRLLKLCYATKRDLKAAASALERPVASVYVSLVRVRRLLMDCIRRMNAQEASR